MLSTCWRTVSVYPNYCTFFAPALALKSWIAYSNMIPIIAKHCPKSVMSVLMKAAILSLPVSKEGIGIASASQIALPAFLASRNGAKCALSCILPEDYVDASFEKALNLWLTKANLSEAPSDFIQKHWTSPLSAATFDQLITDLDVENVKGWTLTKTPLVPLGWMLYQAKISVWS